tara:strand:+ start:1791 stop:2699 length:909 start_codon:yes stop_codon:yes gene_type:complete
MKREAELALDSLRKQNTELSKGGTDGTPDIDFPSTYEQRDIVQNVDGSWSETILQEESPAKKDVQERANELIGHETDATNYENLAKIGDNKVLEILGQINAKKLEIISTINSAVSAGCSVLVGDGLWGPVTIGGVVLGPANTQTVYNTDYPQITEDSAKLYEYDDLNNYSSDAPFSGISSATIIGTNVGTGFSTACFENHGGTVGLYKTITTDISLSGACAGYLNTVNTLASEIDTLRDSLGTDWAAGSYVGVLKDTNQVKDKKTDSELFVWAYKSSDNRIQEKQTSNNSLISTIEGQSEFQ